MNFFQFACENARSEFAHITIPSTREERETEHDAMTLALEKEERIRRWAIGQGLDPHGLTDEERAEFENES